MQVRRLAHISAVAATALAFVPLSATVDAQTRSPRSTTYPSSSSYRSSYYTVDPFDFVPPPGTAVTTSIEARPQFAPFDQGYNLLGGFRPTYQGVPQPIGHEIISTHNGNGYVYRPFYAPSPGYHYTPQGALVIERPGRYPTPSAYVPYIVSPGAVLPGATAIAPPAPNTIPPNALPPRPQPTGPREF